MTLALSINFILSLSLSSPLHKFYRKFDFCFNFFLLKTIQKRIISLIVTSSPIINNKSQKKKKNAEGAFDREIWISILKSGFRICNRTRNSKTDFIADISVFWIFTVLLRNPNSGLVRARIISKNKTAVHENSFANPFSDFPIERSKRKSMKSGLDFLIEIYPEDGFLSGEICFRISRSIAKS